MMKHRLTIERVSSIVGMLSNFVLLNGPAVGPKAWRFAGLCEDLRAYISNNHDARIDYGRWWRKGKPISTSRAESLVNNLVNARMNKRRQMRDDNHPTRSMRHQIFTAPMSGK